jgi:methyl-accepting chemotaxis protein
LLSRLSAGELDVFAGDTERGDEIGALARSLRFFKEEALRAAALAAAEQEARRVRTTHLATLTEQLSEFELQITGVLTMLTAALCGAEAGHARAGQSPAEGVAVVVPASSGD